MHYIYLLKSLDGALYSGCTGDLRRRLEDHNKGKSCHTRGKKWQLIYYEAYLSKYDAYAREKRLKQYGQAMSHLKNRLKNSLGKN